MFTDLKPESVSDLWGAVATADAARIDEFLTTVGVSGVPRAVDFGKSRGNYEQRIFREGVLPMRKGSLHDFYNLLAWARFPLSKRAINRIHHHAIGEEVAAGVSQRGPRRDFLTLLDEAGVLVLVEGKTCPRAIAASIREARENLSFNDYGDAIKRVLKDAGARLDIFGHALLESRDLRPDSLPNVGAFALILPVCSEFNLSADRMVASWLEDHSQELHPALFPSLRLDIVFQFRRES